MSDPKRQCVDNFVITGEHSVTAVSSNTSLDRMAVLPIERTEKEKKVEAKIIDEADENFCGFASFSLVDQDGYARGIKGSSIAGPVRLTRKDGKVLIEANFTPNPLYYMQLVSDSNLYVTGDIWYSEPKKSPTNLIAKIVPKNCKSLLETMEKCKSEEVTVKCEVPFLNGAPNRLAPLHLITKEEKFVTKITGVKLEISEADWAEWKEYRMRFWRTNKAWGGAGGGGDDDEKDKKKDEEEKDK